MDFLGGMIIGWASKMPNRRNLDAGLFECVVA